MEWLFIINDKTKQFVGRINPNETGKLTNMVKDSEEWYF